VPEIVTGVFADTTLVFTVKVALVAPAATVTLAGTAAAVELLESVTTEPPAGAAALRVTVPVAVLPPTTLVGFTTSEDSVTGGGAPAGVTVKVAVPSTPP
jgi:hypothetical protein